MMFIYGLLLSLGLSYLIAVTLCGGRLKDDLDREALKVKNTLRLLIIPYDKRILKLTITLFPLLLFLEAILYWLWLKDVIFER